MFASRPRLPPENWTKNTWQIRIARISSGGRGVVQVGSELQQAVDAWSVVRERRRPDRYVEVGNGEPGAVDKVRAPDEQVRGTVERARAVTGVGQQPDGGVGEELLRPPGYEIGRHVRHHVAVVIHVS